MRIRDRRQTTIALVGPAPPSRGGIASAVEAIRRSEPLRTRYRFVVVRTHTDGGPVAKAVRLAAALSLLARLAMSRRVDVVHVNSASGSSFARKAAATLLARGLGMPVVFHVHGGAFHRQLDGTGPRGRLRRWAIRAVLARADTVVALTPGWAEELGRRLGGRELRVVPNAVPLADAVAEQEEPGTIAFLGALRAEKGVLELVEAIALLAARGRGVRAMLAGTGPAGPAIERRVLELGLPADAVQLQGWLDDEGKASLLARAACFCLPSYEEGLPLALLEAMAAGKPIVATAIGGIPEAARPEREALLVAPRDPAGLADALERALFEPETAAALGTAARLRARSEFGEQALAERLDAVYAELVGARGRRAAMGAAHG